MVLLWGGGLDRFLEIVWESSVGFLKSRPSNGGLSSRERIFYQGSEPPSSEMVTSQEAKTLP